ncbi:molybdenum ABC transporter ATP-binding protein [Methylobacterium oryzihabitans]|uniref:Molybdenum ABC transporter ATP-binding protein n=1 Tax=Methylobacterium oryzihabitans TaxID=2499852 RepID=A0A3S2XRC6_9HYPH|nr:molybdenum ABC transporter ATP-binding protein [Methylobacterium oryzihabitans]RVU21149.1 molybdenum ABC transporter ATP-binding protein [Methylobacterium oryzihabitans]
MIEVAVVHRQGGFTLDAAFTAGGRVTALFGRSGSGKTTLVNVLAGLLRPERGRIAVDGQVLLDTAAGLDVPVHRRRIGYVFQDARLFPHLDVRRNLIFGRRFARDAAGGASLADVAGLLGLAPLLDRRPAGLSGGERQRVAIGRALLARPRLLLMDEPLAALDEARKAEIMPYLARLRDEAGVPIVYVSHAVAEVAQLAGTVVVLSEGRVAATGPAAEILRRADLFHGRDGAEAGTLLDLRVAAHDPGFGLTRLDGPAGSLSVPLLPQPPGTPVRVRVRARDVLIARPPVPDLSARNRLAGRIVAVTAEGSGPHALVEIACGPVRLTARITRQAAHAMGLAPGQEVVAVVKSVAFDSDTIGIAGEVEV